MVVCTIIFVFTSTFIQYLQSKAPISSILAITVAISKDYIYKIDVAIPMHMASFVVFIEAKTVVIMLYILISLYKYAFVITTDSAGGTSARSLKIHMRKAYHYLHPLTNFVS